MEYGYAPTATEYQNMTEEYYPIFTWVDLSLEPLLGLRLNWAVNDAR